jgi:hypothetical protein
MHSQKKNQNLRYHLLVPHTRVKIHVALSNILVKMSAKLEDT